MGSGTGVAATGHAPGAHVCWPYRGVADFAAAAADYIVEGLGRDERVVCFTVGASGTSSAVALADPSADHRHDGRLVVLAREPQRARREADLVADVAMVRHLNDAARADGHSGLRLVTDSTRQVVADGLPRAHARFEHLLGGLGAAGVTVLCGFDVAELDPGTVSDLACLHDAARGLSTPFTLGAAPDGSGGATLRGEVDADSAAQLARTLSAAVLRGQEVTIDVSRLEFIDHRGLLAIDSAARNSGSRVTLVGASALVRWLLQALQVRHVTVEASS